MSSPRRARPFQDFFRTEAASGLVLLAAAALALVAANSPGTEVYQQAWATRLVVGPESHPLTLTARGWVNDGLMALFFLLVGLEIKRELLVGELSTLRQAALPFAAALGGLVVPALIFLSLAPADARAGWAVPTATDIAFALGVLAIVAPGAPPGLKVFLAALAIVDDMAAVLIIAVAYTSAVHMSALLAAAACVVLLATLNWLGVRSLPTYLAIGLALWVFVHESGIHATIAGVALAFTIPTRHRIDTREFAAEAHMALAEFERTETGDLRVMTSRGQLEALDTLAHASRRVTAPLMRLEHALHGLSAFVVMPLFALANAGVALRLGGVETGTIMAVAAGLVLGKPLGITGAAWLACRTGVAALPAGVSWLMLHGAAWIAGIGFTMSLFIAALAFGQSAAFDAAQIGIMGGSLVAACIGAMVLRASRR